MNDTNLTSSHPKSVARLRAVLRLNATTSIGFGAVALFAGSWVSRELGIDHEVVTRSLGAGLIAFALAVLAIARMNEDQLVSEALLVSFADAAWVIGTVVVVASGVLTTAGDVVAALIAAGVAGFGIAQLWFRASALRAGSAQHRHHDDARQHQPTGSELGA